MDLNKYRQDVGIFIFTGNIRFDSANFICRHCSRTRHHTEQDWADTKRHVAYLYTTRHIGLTYHRRRPIDPIHNTIQGASNWGDRIFADGTGVQGNMIVG